MEYYSTIKRNEPLVHTKTGMDLRGIKLSRKKPISKYHILYDLTYMIFLKWQNYRGGEQTCGCQWGLLMGRGRAGNGCEDVPWDTSLWQCGSVYSYLHTWENFYTHTHRVHVKPLKSDEQAVSTVPVFISYFWFCATVVQDVSIVGNWVKATQKFLVHLFNATSSKSIILSKYKVKWIKDMFILNLIFNWLISTTLPRQNKVIL
jgi:hypothetical protein